MKKQRQLLGMGDSFLVSTYKTTLQVPRWRIQGALLLENL